MLSPTHIKSNLLSGLTVALALVPEAIAFALVAQVSPLTGLYAAVLVSFITSSFGGRPGMISAAAGSLAVVMVALVVQHGPQYLFAAVVLMGVLQLLFAAARLGKFIRMVPHPVMLGFVNGLAIVIFVAQFGHFKTPGPDGAMQWMGGAELATMLGVVAVTMAVIYLTPRFTKAVPATLVGILLATAGCALLGIETKTVGDLGSIAGGLPSFALPDVPWNLETLRIVFPYALVLAGVGLIESLLTLTLIDEITDTRGQPNRECLALGASNVITGFFGGMGGCALIGQSMINVNSGGTGRLSGITASLFLLSFILVGSQWIEQIPLAALIGHVRGVREDLRVGHLPPVRQGAARRRAGDRAGGRHHAGLRPGGGRAGRRGGLGAGVRLAARETDPRGGGQGRTGLEGLRPGRHAVLRLGERLPGPVHAEGRSAGRGDRIPPRARG
jgi:SulP family sulfate permease